MSKSFKRILLKLSGEGLLGEQAFGIDENVLNTMADSIKNIYNVFGIKIRKICPIFSFSVINGFCTRCQKQNSNEKCRCYTIYLGRFFVVFHKCSPGQINSENLIKYNDFSHFFKQTFEIFKKNATL